MKLRITIAAAFFMVLIAAVPVYSLSLEELVGTTQAASLRNGEKISEIQLTANSNLNLMPRQEGLRLLTENIRRNLDPGIIAESLQIYVKPVSQSGGQSSEMQNLSWSTAEKLSLFNAMTALSTLQGLQYYSASRGSMRTFYEVSTIIDGPSTKRPQPDTAYTYIPYSLKLYARQKDLTFGDNVYSYDYHWVNDAIFFDQENLTSLTMGIIPAVGRNKLRSVMAIIDAGDCLLFYAVSMAKANVISSLRDRIGNSFSNRAEAVMNWMTDQADRVYSGY